jgi:hypothetical protein
MLLALALGATLASGVVAQQMTADDLAWINRCVRDNQRSGATPEVVRKYCICMNEKMDNTETQSITTWEKSHPKEMAECDKESDWK